MAAHLPRLLEALGATPVAAVAAAALIGPAQVGARLIEFGLLRRVSPLVSARLATVLHPIAAALLAIIGAPAAILFTVLHGGGNGLLTIARGTLPLTLFGSTGYGLRTGLLPAPARILRSYRLVRRCCLAWCADRRSFLTTLPYPALVSPVPPLGPVRIIATPARHFAARTPLIAIVPSGTAS